MASKCAASSAAPSFSIASVSSGASGAASRFPVMFRRYWILLKPSNNSAAFDENADHPPMAKRKNRSESGKSLTKLFVLDTNVLMHDPTSLFRFEEHDLFLPIMTLEELDGHKKGLSEVARNARQASRYLDEIVSDVAGKIDAGIPLRRHKADFATGKLFLQTQALDSALPASLALGKADNHIIGVVMALQRQQPPRQVLLVSKDINMRIKARALGLAAEDYFNDKVLEDIDLLYTGVRELPADFWDLHAKDIESWKKEGRTFYRVKGPLCQHLLVNEFVYQESERPLYAQVSEI